MKIKKILYVIAGNISSTPRALKSIKTLNKHFEITVLFINISNLWLEFDKIFIRENNIKYKKTSLLKNDFIKWLMVTIIHKFAKLMYPLFKNSITITAYASAKSMFLLNKELKKIDDTFDLIIGHTYGALYPVYRYALANQIPFIYDVEDYHPGEAVSDIEKKRREFLMKKILSKATFITYASPLIGKYTLKLLNNYPVEHSLLINNCFPQNEFIYKENNSQKVRFVWFSQNIGKNRGLEILLPAMEKFKNKIELHLIGNLYQDFYQQFLKKYESFIIFHKPMLSHELNLKVADFDVGLAFEMNTADFNRLICLTNKIWVYFQSGLYILATNTPAQVRFLSEHKNIGLITEPNTEDIALKINYILKNIDQIRKKKKERYQNAQNFSWDIESNKILNLLKSLK